MIAKSEYEFVHRLNRDESFDSICKRCFKTIASHRMETVLSAAEDQHNCDGQQSRFSSPTSDFAHPEYTQWRHYDTH